MSSNTRNDDYDRLSRQTASMSLGDDGRPKKYVPPNQRGGNAGASMGFDLPSATSRAPFGGSDRSDRDSSRGFGSFGGGSRGSSGGRGFFKNTSRDNEGGNAGPVSGGYQRDGAPVDFEWLPRNRVLEEALFGKTVASGINFDKYDDIPSSVSGRECPEAIVDFASSNLHPLCKENVALANYSNPTPVQKYSVPTVLAGRDLMACAQTGSGKTAAFLVPSISHMFTHHRPSSNQRGSYSRSAARPTILVLAPTRELALQIEQETRKFCLPLKLNCTAIVGGHSMAEQSVSMRRGVEIVIATPGRLRDCLEQHVLALNQCFRIVLDEADRMIDMNYEEDLAYILSALPQVDPEQMEETDGALPEQASRRRQTTMFSATMPLALDKLARTFLHRPATVTVGETGQAAATVEQRLVMVKEEEKERQLLKILDSRTVEPPIIIFVNTKKTVDAVCRRLESFGHRCVALHGGKNQNQREAAITQVRGSGRDILVATDVAGRGIDIPDVSLVINFDMSKTIEDYIHRIGRTGRAGKRGIAITLLTVEDSEMYYDLRAILEKAPRTAPLPQEFLTHEATRIKPGTVSQKRRHEERIFAYGL